MSRGQPRNKRMYIVKQMMTNVDDYGYMTVPVKFIYLFVFDVVKVGSVSDSVNILVESNV